MRNKYPRYLSYLVRLWQLREKRGWHWRGFLENPGNGERIAFSDLDSLIAFLGDQTSHQERDGQDNKPDIMTEDE